QLAAAGLERITAAVSIDRRLTLEDTALGAAVLAVKTTAGSVANLELGLLEFQRSSIGPDDVVLDYLADLNALTVTLNISHEFANLDTGFNFGLQGTPLSNFNANADFAVRADGDFKITFGIDLGSSVSSMKALRPYLPEGAASDANFTLLISDGESSIVDGGELTVAVPVTL
ncbi:hypothetical protein, partial [Natronococcus sp.]|uniref:hypothetical protein n=1 Tax=Natronococcus sp. TaxID=35747 RepID=UPI003A4E1EF2